MSESSQSQCRSCGAPIVWATTASGQRMPLDPTMGIDGTVAVIGTYDGKTPLVMVVTAAVIEAAREHGTVVLHRSHFASCPDADKWRRRPTTGGRAA